MRAHAVHISPVSLGTAENSEHEQKSRIIASGRQKEYEGTASQRQPPLTHTVVHYLKRSWRQGEHL